ncbi:hypothetical protein ABZT02_01920 [Streptomyces sp. NPDC005402]|uniref:hypothetical protein n=1 Tax=Streptomyces sp. NPDC005402 TaxID=3155338 RepID=UPI0033BEB5E4
MDDFTLEALGLAEAPRDHPLTYPGAWPADSALLDGDRLVPLPRDRRWHEDRAPVLAVGSNASPGQLRHKMAEFGITSPIPMVRARVTGVDVGVSAHVSRMGYVSASPFEAPGAVRELFVLWLDPEQLAVVDASEGVPLPNGNYGRAWLPGVRVELPGGVTLPGVHSYVNRHGVLHDGTGAPRTHPGQRELLTELLVGSARLRELFGVTPEEFVARARADRLLCEAGTRLFADEKRVTESGLERYVSVQQTGSPGTGSSLFPPLR